MAEELQVMELLQDAIAQMGKVIRDKSEAKYQAQIELMAKQLQGAREENAALKRENDRLQVQHNRVRGSISQIHREINNDVAISAIIALPAIKNEPSIEPASVKRPRNDKKWYIWKMAIKYCLKLFNEWFLCFILIFFLCLLLLVRSE